MLHVSLSAEGKTNARAFSDAVGMPRACSCISASSLSEDEPLNSVEAEILSQAPLSPSFAKAQSLDSVVDGAFAIAYSVVLAYLVIARENRMTERTLLFYKA